MRNENSRSATAGHRGKHKPHLPPGFSLLELMVALAVLAIIIAGAAPSMARLLNRVSVQNAYHAMSSSLALARISAISRGHPVTVCPSRDGRFCTGGTNWSGGWIVYLDRGRGSQPQDASDVLEVVTALRSGVSMRTSPGRLRIRYHPTGWASGSNLALTLCTPTTSAMAGKVVVNNAGRTRVERAGPGLPCPYMD